MTTNVPAADRPALNQHLATVTVTKRKEKNLTLHPPLPGSLLVLTTFFSDSNEFMDALPLPLLPHIYFASLFFMSPHAPLFLSSHTLPPGMMTMEILFWEPHVVTA